MAKQTADHSRENFISWLSRKPHVVFLFGHGTKNPYATFSKTLNEVNSWFETQGLVPANTHLVYFGDVADPQKPDVGWLAFQLVHSKGFELGMIQLIRVAYYGAPAFVSRDAIRWHGETEETKEESKIWGGVDHAGKPVKNTKELHVICTQLSSSSMVKPYFLFVGGGPTATAEYRFLQTQNYARGRIFYIPALGAIQGLGDIDTEASTTTTSYTSFCLLS